MLVGITGAGGFIGGRLAPALAARGDRLRCLVRSRARTGELGGEELSAALGDGRLELVEGDLRAREEGPARRGLETFAEGLDAVVHLAGLTRARNPLEFWRVNAGGTKRLAEALRKGSPRLGRLVVLSTFGVHGPSSGPGDFAVEEGPRRPLDPYARSKLAMEAWLEGGAGDLPWTLLRPVPVYGPGDRDFLELFRWASRGLGLGFGRGESLVSMTFVDNLVDAILLALERPEALHEAFLVADVHLSHRGIAALAAGALGRSTTFVELPPALASLASLADELASGLSGRPALLSRHKLRELSWPWWLASSDKARSLLGWEPRVPPAEAFAATLLWYEARGLL